MNIHRLPSCLLLLATLTVAMPLFSAPAAMPLISQGVPAYASDNSSQAGLANNSNYDDSWRSNRTPSSSQPAWLAYDLSSKTLGQVVVTWYSSNYDYNYVLRSGTPYNLFKDYTIQVNSAAGGSVPSSGWVTKVTVSGNEYHSRTATLDLTGYKWIRLNCTAIAGSTSNYDASGNMDVFDARNGAQDTWLFLGDSITAGGMVQSGTTFAQSVRSGNSAYYPSQENGGMAGWKTGDMSARLSQFLGVAPAHYVTLSLGTNDVNTYAGDTTSVNTAYNNLVTMANAVIAAGRVPVIPHVPWARNASIQSNAPTLNAKIDALCASNSNIILGPDLYGYFNSNQSLISSDNLHPTTAGFQSYRNYWAQWALSKIYSASSSGSTPANGTFKILARHSGKAIDAAGAATADGTQIQQWSYNGGNNQRWTLLDRGSSQFSIIGVASGKAIDASGSGTANGTKVQLWTYGGGNNQKWTFASVGSGYYRITPVHATSACLDVNAASTADGALVQLWAYGSGTNEQWAFSAP